MIKYYKKTLLKLIEQLHQIHYSPDENQLLCLSLQEHLIKTITYVESRIRNLKKIQKKLRAQISIKCKSVNSKHNSKILKASLKRTYEKKEGYRCLLNILRAIGDGIAFTYINKWDLKPFAFKEPSGFISEKRGLKLEMESLRYIFSKGKSAILNDITNTLRHGDITIPVDGFPFIIEIKSSKSRIHRGNCTREDRQVRKIDQILKYLATEETKGLYDDSYHFKRVSIVNPEIDHRKNLNLLINEAKNRSYASKEVEPGLFYFISTPQSHFENFKIFFEGINLKRPPIVIFINMGKYDQTAYYPFILSIYNPEDIYSFYTGELFIFVIIDTKKVTDKFNEHGFSCSFQKDEWIIIATPSKNEQLSKLPKICLSQHIFNRIFFEFISLDWLLNETISKAIENYTEYEEQISS